MINGTRFEIDPGTASFSAEETVFYEEWNSI